MTKQTQHVDINSFTFQQAELDRRVEQAQFLFLRSYNSIDILAKPASLLIPELQELILNGRRVSKQFPANNLPSLTVYLEKENIDDLLAAVADETEAKYRAELEENKEANKLLLAQQLFNQKKEKEAKALQAKEEKDKASALAEAEEYFANLASVKEAV